jgi:hypothetical protein
MSDMTASIAKTIAQMIVAGQNTAVVEITADVLHRLHVEGYTNVLEYALADDHVSIIYPAVDGWTPERISEAKEELYAYYMHAYEHAPADRSIRTVGKVLVQMLLAGQPMVVVQMMQRAFQHLKDEGLEQVLDYALGMDFTSTQLTSEGWTPERIEFVEESMLEFFLASYANHLLETLVERVVKKAQAQEAWMAKAHLN